MIQFAITIIYFSRPDLKLLKLYVAARKLAPLSSAGRLGPRRGVIVRRKTSLLLATPKEPRYCRRRRPLNDDTYSAVRLQSKISMKSMAQGIASTCSSLRGKRSPSPSPSADDRSRSRSDSSEASSRSGSRSSSESRSRSRSTHRSTSRSTKYSGSKSRQHSCSHHSASRHSSRHSPSRHSSRHSASRHSSRHSPSRHSSRHSQRTHSVDSVKKFGRRDSYVSRESLTKLKKTKTRENLSGREDDEDVEPEKKAHVSRSSSSNPLTSCFRKKSDDSEEREDSIVWQEEPEREPQKGTRPPSALKQSPPAKAPAKKTPAKKPRKAAPKKKKKAPKRAPSRGDSNAKKMTAGESRIPDYEKEAEKRRFPFNIFSSNCKSKKDEEEEKPPKKKPRRPTRPRKSSLPALTPEVMRKGSKRVTYRMPTGEKVPVRRSSRIIERSDGKFV